MKMNDFRLVQIISWHIEALLEMLLLHIVDANFGVRVFVCV